MEGFYWQFAVFVSFTILADFYTLLISDLQLDARDMTPFCSSASSSFLQLQMFKVLMGHIWLTQAWHFSLFLSLSLPHTCLSRSINGSVDTWRETRGDEIKRGMGGVLRAEQTSAGSRSHGPV